MRTTSILCLMLSCGLALASDPPTTHPGIIQASDKAALEEAMGREVIVEGVVESAEWSRTGKVMNIDFKDTQESRLLAVIFERSKDAMNEAFGGDVGRALTGAKVRIKGKLEPYGGQVEEMKGRPQIIIRDGHQITILEPASAPTAPPTIKSEKPRG